MSPGQINALIKYEPSFMRLIIGTYKGPYEIKPTDADNEVILSVPTGSGNIFPYRFVYGGQTIKIYLNDLHKQPLKIRKIEKCSPQTR